MVRRAVPAWPGSSGGTLAEGSGDTNTIKVQRVWVSNTGSNFAGAKVITDDGGRAGFDSRARSCVSHAPFFFVMSSSAGGRLSRKMGSNKPASSQCVLGARFLVVHLLHSMPRREF